MKFMGKAFIRISMLAFIATTTFSAAGAQELSPDHLALAREYVEITDQAKVYEITLIETGIATMRTIISQNPEITDEVSAAIGVVIQDYSTQKDRLFDQFARVYALRFSEAELAEIVAFYKSDVGLKLTEENVGANRELQTVMQVFRSNLNNEFFAKVRAELRSQDITI